MELGILMVILVVSTGALIWMLALLISDVSAAIYVPTPITQVEEMLKSLKMEPGKSFVDLGSGDGRLVRKAARLCKMRAVGYEINPFLIAYSKLVTKLQSISLAQFYGKSFWSANLSEFDYVYTYLYPNVMQKLAQKLEKELKRRSTVISKAFEIKGWNDKLIEKLNIEDKVFWIYKI